MLLYYYRERENDPLLFLSLSFCERARMRVCASNSRKPRGSPYFLRAKLCVSLGEGKRLEEKKVFRVTKSKLRSFQKVSLCTRSRARFADARNRKKSQRAVSLRPRSSLLSSCLLLLRFSLVAASRSRLMYQKMPLKEVVAPFPEEEDTETTETKRSLPPPPPPAETTKTKKTKKKRSNDDSKRRSKKRERF